MLLFFNVCLEGRSVVICMCLHELGIQDSGFPEVLTELWPCRGTVTVSVCTAQRGTARADEPASLDGKPAKKMLI